MNVQVLNDRAQQRRRSEPGQRLAGQRQDQQKFDHPSVGRAFFAARHVRYPPANLSYCGSRVMSSGAALAFTTRVRGLVNLREAEIEHPVRGRDFEAWLDRDQQVSSRERGPPPAGSPSVSRL